MPMSFFRLARESTTWRLIHNVSLSKDSSSPTSAPVLRKQWSSPYGCMHSIPWPPKSILMVSCKEPQFKEFFRLAAAPCVYIYSSSKPSWQFHKLRSREGVYIYIFHPLQDFRFSFLEGYLCVVISKIQESPHSIAQARNLVLTLLSTSFFDIAFSSSESSLK